MPRASLSAPAQRAPRQRLPRSSGLPAAGLQATDFPGRKDRNADSCLAVRCVAFVFPGKARGSRVIGFSVSPVLGFSARRALGFSGYLVLWLWFSRRALVYPPVMRQNISIGTKCE